MDNAQQGKTAVAMYMHLPAPVCLLVSQDNHEIFLTIASYEPEYVERFEANFSNPRAVTVDQATTYY
ncbi:uncharacterized protein N7487_008385 [Penicillium crustosum]|uniref:uncharacterized protein n=1 Tax=Penicillium crustosum TaxID=36656 RepID=UPI00238F31D6|nr:uncharacterized protein N7487_008385 [Penicillium crustosum]KAJ5402489.1 hypothetical protein N7487_008385 [Penicillium crustosum]